jgi:cytochrome c-type biogenesis protein CcsB
MDALVRFSFYCFTAATIAMVGSMLCYLGYAIGRVRVRQATVQTSAGTTVVGSTAEFGPRSNTLARLGTTFAWFALGFQVLSVGLRTIAAGRIPLANMYEFSLSFLVLLLLVYLLFERAYGVRQLGAVVMPIAVGMAAYIWSLPAVMREVDPLIPALQHITLMTIHVSLALLAYSTFAVAFAAASLYLIVTHWHVGWLPGAALLDDFGFRAVTVGFPALSLVLIIGSVWAHQAWGSYWSWDPKETAALFTWLIYAVYLHTRTLRGWRGNRSAWILVFGFLAAIFTYYGNYFFGGMHAYGGI